MLGIDFKSAVLNLYYQRICSIKMALRKVSIGNSVRYFPKSEKTKEREIKPKKIKAGSVPLKQNKNIPQNSKKIPEKFCSEWIWST